LDDFEDAEGFEEVRRKPSPRNPCQKKSEVCVKRRRRGGETFILCTSSGRMVKDRMIREKQEQRFLVDLGKLQRRIDRGQLVNELAVGEAIGRLKERYPRVARYHRLRFDAEQGKLLDEPDLTRKAKAEMLDGGYLLRTDRDDLDAEQTWLMYITLTRVEAAFRAMKSPLAERPMLRAAGEGATFAATGGQVGGCTRGREMELVRKEVNRGRRHRRRSSALTACDRVP